MVFEDLVLIFATVMTCVIAAVFIMKITKFMLQIFGFSAINRYDSVVFGSLG